MLLNVFFLFNLILHTVDAANCTTYRTRYEIHDLTNSELNTFLGAIQKLYTSGNWTTFVKKHYDLRSQVHGFAQFLPFHSVFIYDLETALMQYNPNITLPFWNSSMVSQNPISDPIFNTSLFGDTVAKRNCSNGRCCVTSGNFKNWTFDNSTVCLSRDYSSYSGGFFSWLFFKNALNTTDFNKMATKIEQLHSNVHTWVGGIMKTHLSPLDPLFFLHHSFVDKIWYDWRQNNTMMYNGTNFDNTPANVNDTIYGYPQHNVSHILDNHLCVRYVNKRNLTCATTSGCVDSPSIIIPKNIINGTLRNATIDRNWLLHNGFNQSQISQLFNDLHIQTANINTKLKNISVPINGSVDVPGVGTLDPSFNLPSYNTNVTKDNTITNNKSSSARVTLHFTTLLFMIFI